MNTKHALKRADAAVALMRGLTPPPDVVMLQEVTSVPITGEDPAACMLARFRDGMGDSYALHADENAVAGGAPYFIVMLVRKALFNGGEEEDVRCEPFPASQQSRGVIVVTGSIGGKGKGKGKGARRRDEARLCFVTSHLESERAGTEQRKAQLTEIVVLMRKNAADGVVTIFGGDTNLREPEVSGAVFAKTSLAEQKERAASSASRPPERRKVGDAFVQAGAPDADRYTWDMVANNNLDMSSNTFLPRTRYDRVFVFGPAARFPAATTWTLLGKTRLECGVFVSDHWGVLVDLKIPAGPDEEEEAGEEEKEAEEEEEEGGAGGGAAGRGVAAAVRDDAKAGKRTAKRRKSSERRAEGGTRESGAR